jgi:hypothetical protein
MLLAIGTWPLMPCLSGVGSITGLGDGIAAVSPGVLLGLGLAAAITPADGLCDKIAGVLVLAAAAGTVALGAGSAAALLTKGDKAKTATSPAIFILIYITSCQL